MTTAQDTYIYTMDPFPLQTKEFNRLYKFYDYLREDRLTTTRCTACASVHWPPRVVCPECISDQLEWIDLPREGTIYVYSVNEAGVPMGFKPPLIFALVDLDNGTRIFTRIIDVEPDAVDQGARVVLKVSEIPQNRVLHTFTLKR